MKKSTQYFIAVTVSSIVGWAVIFLIVAILDYYGRIG